MGTATAAHAVTGAVAVAHSKLSTATVAHAVVTGTAQSHGVGVTIQTSTTTSSTVSSTQVTGD